MTRIHRFPGKEEGDEVTVTRDRLTGRVRHLQRLHKASGQTEIVRFYKGRVLEGTCTPTNPL